MTPRRRAEAAGAVAAGALVARVASGLRARRAIDWQPGHVSVHHGSLTARVLGSDGTPVVLLHGQAGSGRYWGSAYDALGTCHRVVVPDLLGFGDSPRPDGPYDADRRADAVLGCLESSGSRRQPWPWRTRSAAWSRCG